MGQRANYILIESNRKTFYYTHWRANRIAADLFLGEKRFVAYIKNCKIVEKLIDEPWIEGCVIINRQKKQLYFWSLEFSDTTVIQLYLKKLQEKWTGWHVEMLYNNMYDAEKILEIDYISRQELNLIPNITADDLEVAEPGDWATLVIIKIDNVLKVFRISGGGVEGLLNIGTLVIDLLFNKTEDILPKEKASDFYQCLIIDIINKKIIIAQSEMGLWEQVSDKWHGYIFQMGNFGYIGALTLAGIPTLNLTMNDEEVLEEFRDLTATSTNFDPVSLANKILSEEKNVKFNSDFFENTSPQKTLLERIKSLFSLR